MHPGIMWDQFDELSISLEHGIVKLAAVITAAAGCGPMEWGTALPHLNWKKTVTRSCGPQQYAKLNGEVTCRVLDTLSCWFLVKL